MRWISVAAASAVVILTLVILGIVLSASFLSRILSLLISEEGSERRKTGPVPK
ncbi:MAG TPA: hypothetical protein VMI94_12425 [Bryobacteraceae bacterium]|nr:hypothetical protein [Bryobacteraceae bacterium]